MKTIILPGFSDTNREWARETKNALESSGHEAVIHEWKHWETQNKADWNPDREANEVIDKHIKNDSVNILGKSLGTLVTVKIASKVSDKINKIILCGIPLYDIDEEEKK